VAAASLDGGGTRAFVAVREGDRVVAADLAADGTLTCSTGGTDCNADAVRFPDSDPQALAVVGPWLYVSGIAPYGERGIVAAEDVNDPIWTGGAGELVTRSLGLSGGGGITGRCAAATPPAEACSAGGTVHVAGRALVAGSNPIYVFDFSADDPFAGDVFRVNLFGEVRGIDSRGIALGTRDDTVYVATRFPDALVVLDEVRVPAEGADGCVVVDVSGDLSCTGLPAGTPVPSFEATRLISAPANPTRLAAIPRADGTDLVVAAAEDALAFFDPVTGLLLATLAEVGSVPSAVAWRPLATGGARLYVPSYGRGSIAVVDVPDLFAPRTASVVARLGPVQEGSF
jgi:hypothetical protein